MCVYAGDGDLQLCRFSVDEDACLEVIYMQTYPYILPPAYIYYLQVVLLGTFPIKRSSYVVVG